MRRRLWLGITLALTLELALGTPPCLADSASHSYDFRSMQRKLAYLKANATKPHSDSKPVELTESEVNAYFSEGGVKLPRGVSRVRLTSRAGVIDGDAHVDFEPILQGRNPNNPLYSLFSGNHEVHVVAQGAGVNGVASIKIQSVALDGVTIPPWMLEFFVQHYLTPRYPSVGITSTFKMPLRITTATVESGKVRLEQR